MQYVLATGSGGFFLQYPGTATGPLRGARASPPSSSCDLGLQPCETSMLHKAKPVAAPSGPSCPAMPHAAWRGSRRPQTHRALLQPYLLTRVSGRLPRGTPTPHYDQCGHRDWTLSCEEPPSHTGALPGSPAPSPDTCPRPQRAWKPQAPCSQCRRCLCFGGYCRKGALRPPSLRDQARPALSHQEQLPSWFTL